MQRLSEWVRRSGLRQLARELADDIWVIDLGGDNRGARREENIFEIETPVAIVTVARSGPGNHLAPACARYRRVSGTAVEKLSELSRVKVDLDGSEWMETPNDWHASFIPSSGAEGWTEYPLLTDLFPWQQPGCKFGRTWPISPTAETLVARWSRFVSTDDPDDRARCFVTANTGRGIYTTVTKLKRLADEPIGGAPPPIVRYGYRSFDRQWAFEDARLAALERPSLWASRSNHQIFMATMHTKTLGAGLAASASIAVPDLDFYCGRGGKDIIPLYRDAAGTPNTAPSTLEKLTEAYRAVSEGAEAVTVEALFAYAYALLAGTDYTDRFTSELETPGPRVPLTTDRALFDEAVELGHELLWLHTYGERCAHGRERDSLKSDKLSVVAPIRSMPTTPREIRYDAVKRVLSIGQGRMEGVTPEVWNFEVSGMPVVRKWLGYRTAQGAGRAASSGSPLDKIRPTAWPEEWTVELLELLSVLQRTVDILPKGADLLDRICVGPLLRASDLPAIPPDLRKPPDVNRAAEQHGFGI